MMIVVNQRDEIAWHEDLTVRRLLAELNYTYPHIVVSVNGAVVPHDAYDDTAIPDEADVRIIHLMAGG